MNDNAIASLTKAIERLAAAIETKAVYTATTTTPMTLTDTGTTTARGTVTDAGVKPLNITTTIEAPVLIEPAKIEASAPAPVEAPKPKEKKVRLEDLVTLAQKILDKKGLEQLRELNKRHDIERISKTP